VRRRLKIILLLAAFIGAAAVLRALGRQWLEPAAATALLRSLGDSAWAMPVLAFAYLIGSSFLLPAVLFHVVAGASFGFAKAFLFNMVAGNVISNLQFWGGRLAGRDRMRGWLTARGFPWLVEELETSGLWTMLVVRQLPLPFVVVNAAAGASPMPWWHFLVGSGLGLFPGNLIYTYFAAALAEGVEGAREAVLLRALSAGAGVVVLSLGARLLQRRFLSAKRPGDAQRTTPT